MIIPAEMVWLIVIVVGSVFVIGLFFALIICGYLGGDKKDIPDRIRHIQNIICDLRSSLEWDHKVARRVANDTDRKVNSLMPKKTKREAYDKETSCLEGCISECRNAAKAESEYKERIVMLEVATRIAETMDPAHLPYWHTMSNSQLKAWIEGHKPRGDYALHHELVSLAFDFKGSLTITSLLAKSNHELRRLITCSDRRFTSLMYVETKELSMEEWIKYYKRAIRSTDARL